MIRISVSCSCCCCCCIQLHSKQKDRANVAFFSLFFSGVFSHTHLVGAGVTDFGNVGLMPVIMPRSDLDESFFKNYAFKSSFSHSREVPQAGYYQVHLDRYNIMVELTATRYVGVHRYTYPSDQLSDAMIIFDVSSAIHSKSCKDAQVFIDVQKQEIYGWVYNSGSLTKAAGNIYIYFFAKMDKIFTSFGVWNFNSSSVVQPGVATTRGDNIGAFISGIQLSSDRNVTVQVALSFISIDQARKNFANDFNEVGNLTFDNVRQSTQQLWNDELNRIRIKTPNTVDKVKFYTAYYHSLCSPTIYTEAGNSYLGFDGKIHTGEDFNFVSDLSLWDVHRTQLPFLNLMYGKKKAPYGSYIGRDIVKSLIAMFEQSGSLPRWPIASGDGDCMIGTHGITAIVDGFMKGLNLSSEDRDQAYAAITFAATKQQKRGSRAGLEDYLTKGYVPVDKYSHGVCMTLEYAYEDWSVGLFIKEYYPSKIQEAMQFLNRSLNYRNVFNNYYQFHASRKSDGSWVIPISWLFFGGHYVEGNAWHYRFYVPHDIAGLASSFNNTQHFIDQLDEFFHRSQFFPFNFLPNPYYWAGNEHDLFSVWAFNWVKRQDKTQKYARWLLDHKYTDQPDGLPGNDDYGTMSAWFLLTSIGIYPLSGSNRYTLGAPLFERVEMDMYPNCTLIIQSKNYCPECVYVKSVYINATPLAEPFIYHDKHLTCTSTMNSIDIVFYMDSKPHPGYNNN